MFCYQCEQTKKGEGCDSFGICGKDPETAVLQDLLVQLSKETAFYAHRARLSGKHNIKIDRFLAKALFTTVTNVNFDPERLAALIKSGVKMRALAHDLCKENCAERMTDCKSLKTTPINENASVNELVELGARMAIVNRFGKRSKDVVGVEELITYGLKGMAAYVDHAMILGQEDDEVFSFISEALDFLNEEHSLEELLGMALRVGEVNLKVMGMLDNANTGAYGHPEPTAVKITPVKGKAILISGHDLKDLEELLKQTEGKGINIYTHGEMLPALAYPGLKKYKHLAGNYGGAWQEQAKEFDAFPGSILMTTNCIQKPRETYKGRIFTCGLVAWPGVTHIPERDFTPVIEAALAAPGFAEDEPEKTITIGFARKSVLSVADKVIDAVKSGAIKHFFLIGGCDGAKSGRNYFTELAQAVPDDSVILTLACGKFRFNKLEFGNIGGIPRLLDIGQCNDAYSAVQIAVALAEAFDTDVNSLPLSMVLSWYEQKAVCILLSLLHLGIKNIRLGPTLPAFITPDVLNVLVDNFNIMPTTTAEEDLKAILD